MAMFFKFKNQNLNANWLLVDPVREDSVLDVIQKGKSDRKHHESNNSVCVCACAFHDNEKREKYVRLFVVLDQWNATVLQEKEPKLWCCPSIYFTCMDNLYMPHTVCIGFANEQTVIAATIEHTVTSHSTQRLAKIKVKKLYLLIMPMLLWMCCMKQT